MRIPITDPADPQLDDYRALRERDLRREGLFVGEQALVVGHMLALPGVTKSVLVAENMAERVAPLAPPEVPVYVAPLSVLRTVAGFDLHRGVVAVGYRAPFDGRAVEDVVPAGAGPARLLACEGITHIDNIGLLFRTAAALGVDGVLLDPTCHDPLYRKSLRVSIGHALTLPWARSSDWPGDLARLKAERGLTVIGAALAPDATPLGELDPPGRCVLVVGSEFHGLAPATLALCDEVVRIPMAPGVDSLNVAVAAGVALWALGRG